MMTSDLTLLSVKELLEGYKGGSFSPTEVVSAYTEAIAKKNPELNAYICPTTDLAAAQLANVGDGPLAGVPMSLKDVYSTKGIPTTACSNILKGFKPPYDAPVVERLYKAGAVLLGKVNTDEFTCGTTSESSCFGPTLNPYDTSRVAGGSSGGSAASVAANLCAFSLGTDTGGSIRLPASFCGIVGLKVTYGRVPRAGVISMASSLDTIGPMTKTVYDAALVLEVISGHHRMDATTPDVPVGKYVAGLDQDISGLRIGLPKEFFAAEIDPEVERLVRAAVKEYEKMGATVKEVSLPMTKYGVAVYYIVCPSEVSSNMSRYDGVRYGPRAGDPKDLYEFYTANRSAGFSDELKRRIMLGTYALSSGYYDAYYVKAQKVRTLTIQSFNDVFKEVDVLMGPVVPFPATKVGEFEGDPLAMYQADALTIPASIAGMPGLSLPCGLTDAGLPVGLQIIGPHWSEEKILNVAYKYEQLHG